jgi:hypothetical protein
MDYKDIESIPLRKMKRKEFLDPMAEKLGIISKEYKNKSLLYDAIIKKLKIVNENMYWNSRDPITLEDLNEIESKYIISWEQNGKKYCCRIDSLYMMFENSNGRLLNPFAIDEATGIDFAKDRDSYNDKFSLNKVEGLYEKVTRLYVEMYGTEVQDILEDVPESVKIRFDIERVVPNMYVSHIVEKIMEMNEREFIRLIDAAIFNVLVLFRTTMTREDVSNEETYYTLCSLNEIYIQVRKMRGSMKNCSKKAHDIFMQMKYVFDDTVLESTFDFMDKILEDR